jgi:hypothetical protein
MVPYDENKWFMGRDDLSRLSSKLMNRDNINIIIESLYMDWEGLAKLRQRLHMCIRSALFMTRYFGLVASIRRLCLRLSTNRKTY